jgi:SAF domain
MKNWIIAAIALALGTAVTVALLVFANPARDEVYVYAAARDIPAGSLITRDFVETEGVVIPDATSSFFSADDGSQLVGLRASRDVPAGQLIQRADVMPASGSPDERLVFIPVKDAPPAAPGAHLDLLLISGTPDHPDVVPFALGVEVREAVTGGFIVAVPSRQAPAFVYAAEVMRLVAVVGAPGSPPGSEAPVDAPDQAVSLASQQ